MPLLTRKKQLALVIEGTPGVPASSALTTVANAAMLVFDASLSPSVEYVDRDYIRDSISPLKQTPGLKLADMSFSTEMRGPKAPDNETGDDAPLWMRLLEAANFRKVQHYNIVTGVGALASGPLRHGELADINGTAASVIRILHEVHDGDTTIYYELISGTPAADASTCIGQSTGATCTLSTPTYALDGWTYYPISKTQFTVSTTGTLSGAISAGDVIEFQNSGAQTGRGVVTSYDGTVTPDVLIYELIRGVPANTNTVVNLSQTGTGLTLSSVPSYYQGATFAASLFEDGLKTTLLAGRTNVTVSLEANNPGSIEVTGQGKLDTSAPDADGGTGDYALLAGIDYDLSSPPLWEGATIMVADNEGGATTRDDEQEPCLTTLSLDIGNSLTQRRCAGATNGLEEIAITERAGTASMDPEATLETDIDWLSMWQTGDVMRLRTTLGTAAGDSFTISAPGIQVTGAASGDRDGMMTRDFSGNLTGGNLTNLDGGTVTLSSGGGDNELVISYHAVHP